MTLKSFNREEDAIRSQVEFIRLGWRCSSIVRMADGSYTFWVSG